MRVKRSLIDELSEESKRKIKITNSPRGKEGSIPPGYVRYRCNENCNYDQCGYREHQTHFHCMRKDCSYSFCDKTRFVQHSVRHDRLDALMAGEFKQFRNNQDCGRSDCIYKKSSLLGSASLKASHFHCLKCDFLCSDTNKLLAHRKQHERMEQMKSAGFQKFVPGQSCNLENCNYNRKQTHYHCQICHISLLGFSQMPAHKARHDSANTTLQNCK